MPTLGVDVVIIDADNKVLLTKRADVEVWCLPGGGVDDGETVAQAAIREAREETGLEVELDRLVGIYSRPRWRRGGDHNILFSGRPVGGIITPAVGEVLEAGYFDPEVLPEPFLAWHRQRIVDALSGVSGIVSLQDTPWPFPENVSLRDLGQAKDQTGKSMKELFLQYFASYDSSADRVEVGEKRR